MTDTVATPDVGDEFASAFAEATGSAAPAAATPTTPTSEPAPATPPAAAATSEPAAVTPAPAADTAPATPTAPVVAPAEPVAPAVTTEPSATPAAQPTAQLTAQDIAQAMTEALKATQPAAPSTEPVKPADVPLTMDTALSEDDKRALTEYEKDWPEVAAAENRRRTAAIKVAQDEIYREVAKELAPIVGVVRQLTAFQHHVLVHQAHPDFDQVKPDVDKWIDTQPEYYRPALKHVMQQGNTTQVVELFSVFKEATGRTGAVPAAAAPASTTPTQTTPTVAAPAVPAAAPSVEAAAAALGAVSSQRTAPPASGPDQNDFDAAFKEFAAAGKK